MYLYVLDFFCNGIYIILVLIRICHMDALSIVLVVVLICITVVVVIFAVNKVHDLESADRKLANLEKKNTDAHTAINTIHKDMHNDFNKIRGRLQGYEKSVSAIDNKVNDFRVASDNLSNNVRDAQEAMQSQAANLDYLQKTKVDPYLAIAGNIAREQHDMEIMSKTLIKSDEMKKNIQNIEGGLDVQGIGGRLLGKTKELSGELSAFKAKYSELDKAFITIQEQDASFARKLQDLESKQQTLSTQIKTSSSLKTKVKSQVKAMDGFSNDVGNYRKAFTLDSPEAMLLNNGYDICFEDPTRGDLCLFSARPRPKDCELSEWSAWSDCSKSCGTGEQNRSRTIVGEPQKGGKACPPVERLTEKRACNTQVCQGGGLSS